MINVYREQGFIDRPKRSREKGENSGLIPPPHRAEDFLFGFRPRCPHSLGAQPIYPGLISPHPREMLGMWK